MLKRHACIRRASEGSGEAAVPVATWPLLPSPPSHPPIHLPPHIPLPQLDKHNERRRKAEIEQKAQMPQGQPRASGSGTEAHRTSPYSCARAGTGYASHTSLMTGLGGSSGGDMVDRLQQLAGEPGMQVRAGL